ncbi:HTH-type transcriptional regulator CdhR [Roseibaca ekhonensis]|uniref:HTH-type transcriptional regulator CdhR n=2 Tax=Roseinatronobacter ekhonensis TaxID=254356 RepID=A0A3B0MY46_9RHOB|nr:HTH-type transcriptional regulator CdhR [Roseibaca ekhonensis]
MFTRSIHSMTENENIQLGFLIFPGFPMACLTSMIEPLRAANEIADTRAFEWTLISEEGGPVESSAAVAFHPNCALAGAAHLDYLFLLSPPTGTFIDPRKGYGALRNRARHGAIMGGVSGGVFPLARSGLLDGHVTSVHWCYAAAFADEFPDHRTTDDVIMVDRRRVTISGAAAGFDLALRLIQQRLGDEVTTEVACWFQHPFVRGDGVRQRVPALRSTAASDMLPEPVGQALRIMDDHLEDPIAVGDICEQIGISPRHLERLFKMQLGKSPKLYYREKRLDAARQLVMYSNRPLREIALASGFSSPSALRKRYAEAYSLTPEEDRDRINMFRVQQNAPVPSS